MNIKNFIIALTIIVGFIAPAEAQKKLSCGGDYRLKDQVNQGYPHHDIERAGVILCKDYKHDDRTTHDRYAIILGHDRNLNVWSFQAGKVEPNHTFTYETAAAELFEETGGEVDYSPLFISKLPYIYASQKQLFFLRDDQQSVRQIKQSCLIAVNNPFLFSSQREVDNIVAVSVKDLLELAYHIHHPVNGKPALGKRSRYKLKSRSARKTIEIDGYYMRMLANRYEESRQIFNQIFHTNVF